MTAQQRQVSHALLATLAQKREHLVWAVTGAGKTEMLFPVIHRALQAKQRVAIVSPRIDVILELAPRLQAAFQQTPLVVFVWRTAATLCLYPVGFSDNAPNVTFFGGF